jgi:lysophospholipase L1-like esterase
VELGVIGLCNKGKPRKPDDWGAIRAWGWGLSRLIDYFEKDTTSMVDPKSVGIEGVSRYGKAALAAQAFDPRVAVAFVASSGAGGAKLLRHVFGERLENIAGGALYWMAGNWLKYSASDPEKTVADLPVDAHELIALCAPRPCFISYGIPEKGDPRGSYMAGILASPVYRLLGKNGLSSGPDDIMTPMPTIQTLVGGELAWRQHEGGHEATPNWPTFFEWVSKFIAAPPLPTDHKPLRAQSDVPSSRTDSNSLIAHFQLVQKATKGGIDVYFEGDSITRRWGTSDSAWKDNYDNWKANFWGWNAGNFGWGADSTQNILWRLKNGELEDVNPKIIVILAGTNNVGSRQSVDEVSRGVQAIVDLCHAKAPKAKIILTAIFPRNDNMAYMKTINAVNENLGKLASRSYVRFLNVNAGLAAKDGKLFDGMTIDNLHPSVKGFQVWADGLKPILTELIGPPATTDHAPPPTGDPSASPPRQGGRSIGK